MILKQIIKEIRYRKLGFILGFIAVSLAVSLFVVFFTMTNASKKETIRLTRDMGLNLYIIPAEAGIDNFWTNGYSDQTMPEKWIKKFYDFKNFSFAHITAVLKQKIFWEGNNIFLTGLSPDFEPTGQKKTSMVFNIKKGTAYLGYELAEKTGFQEGEKILVYNKEFIIEKNLGETGSSDDMSMYVELHDAQEILGLNGKINEIRALNCLCINPEETDPLDILRSQLKEILPGTKMTMNKSIAIARERQRVMLDKYFAIILPVILIVAGIWIAALSWLNTRERKYETGILRAIGYGTGKIAILLLSRNIIIGILSAIAGFILGTWLSMKFGPDIFLVSLTHIQVDYLLLLKLLVAIPLFTVLSAVIPVAHNITNEPALILNND
ncbi:ABC transporter permease [Bacteroidota bacterium]